MAKHTQAIHILSMEHVWIFLIKFWRNGQFLERSILTQQNYNLKLLCMSNRNYSLTCYLQTNMMSRWSLYWGYTFINGVYRWRHEGGHVIFPRILTGVQNSHFKCQSPQNLWTWSLNVINSVKGHYAICRLDYVLRKTTWSSWWHLWPGILSKSNSNLYSHFKAYHKTWKQCDVTSNCDMCMRRC